MSLKDYLAHLVVEPGDREDHGVKGMKWGIRRSSAQLSSAPAAAPSGGSSSSAAPKPRIEAKASGGSSPAKGHIQDHVESSSTRYARLAAQAKQGKASSMTEQDLKFFNARTEALAKINKLNESQPSWLSATSKKVLQQTAQNQLQSISDGIANKYISGPILDNSGKHKSKS